jgi:hypothetical protein
VSGRLGRILLWLLPALMPGSAAAHELTMAELDLREFGKGQFYWSWGPGSGSITPQAELTPRWPDDCADAEQQLSCEGGLVGPLAVDGIGRNYSAAMVRITWLDGQRRVYTITQAQPTVQLYGAAEDARGGAAIATAYTMLGIEHILGGIDHLLFVICLLFLVGFNRRLVWTITAFTVAHSLTLASSVLGLVTLRSAPVETVIALSIVLTAYEALNGRRTLTHRLPALVAFGFGLVHGLGFAGVLTEIGLPERHLLLALATFNVGVEIGQLATVAAAFGLVRLSGRAAWVQAARRPALYAIGTVAAFWSIERFATVTV